LPSGPELPSAPAPAPAPAPARDAHIIVGKTNALAAARLAIIADGTPIFATQSSHKHFENLPNKIEAVKSSRNGVHYLRHNGQDYASPTALIKALNIKRTDAAKHIWFSHNGVYKTMWDACGGGFPTQVAPTA
jgi:hypothetical protein